MSKLLAKRLGDVCLVLMVVRINNRSCWIMVDIKCLELEISFLIILGIIQT